MNLLSSQMAALFSFPFSLSTASLIFLQPNLPDTFTSSVFVPHAVCQQVCSSTTSMESVLTVGLLQVPWLTSARTTNFAHHLSNHLPFSSFSLVEAHWFCFQGFCSNWYQLCLFSLSPFSVLRFLSYMKLLSFLFESISNHVCENFQNFLLL